MIDMFLSRPNWIPDVIDAKMKDLYALFSKMELKPNTIDKTNIPLQSPFEDVRRILSKCKCTIVLGLPQIFIHDGSIKNEKFKGNFATEWNQIEATMSIMIGLPTLVLLHNSVIPRGIFERGAANIYVHSFNVLEKSWLNDLMPAINSLKEAIIEN